MSKVNSKQQGFSILSIVLGVVAVSVVIGVWSFSGQNNTANSTSNSNKIQSSSVMNEAANIKTEYDRLVINGSSASSIVFVPNVASTSTAPNILDTIKGIPAPKPNKNIIRFNASNPEGMWVYNGTTIMLSGIKDTVCKSINASLYNSNVIPAVSSVANGAAFVTGATVTQTAYCSSGYTGSWTQTRTYTAAPAPTCWTPSGWTPASAPPGACTASCAQEGSLIYSYCWNSEYWESYNDGYCGNYDVNYGNNGMCG